MVAPCFHQDSVQNKHLPVLWILWMTCMSFSTVVAADSKDLILLRKHVGEEVAFPCPPEQGMDLAYLIKGEDFVNGYYGSKNMSENNPWLNSRVDKEKNLIYVSRLEVSHAGLYTCQYDTNIKETRIQLIITANYSKPSIYLYNCTDKKDQCLVQCSSHGGYPKTKNTTIWNVTAFDGPPIALSWINESFEEDNNTQLFNLSSIVSFNCSTGKQQNISCSVDGISSVLSVCKQESNVVKVHVAYAILGTLFILAVVVFVVWKKCRRGTGPYRATNQDEFDNETSVI